MSTVTETARGNPRSSGYPKKTLEWYVEERWFVEALIDYLQHDMVLGRHFAVGTYAWDPACGGGQIPDVLMSRGLVAFGTDIVCRGYNAHVRPIDFLTEPVPLIGKTMPGVIVTNPPFSLARRFVERALELPAITAVVIAQRLAFLETPERATWFRESGLTRVLIPSSRVHMPPGGTDIKPEGGAITFGWFIWLRGHTGLWTGDFLARPERAKPKRKA